MSNDDVGNKNVDSVVEIDSAVVGNKKVSNVPGIDTAVVGNKNGD